MIAIRLAALLAVPVLLTGCMSAASQIIQEEGASEIAATTADNIWGMAEVIALMEQRPVSEADLKRASADISIEEMPTTVTVTAGPTLTVAMTIGSITCTSVVSKIVRTPQTTCVQ